MKKLRAITIFIAMFIGAAAFVVIALKTIPADDAEPDETLTSAEETTYRGLSRTKTSIGIFLEDTKEIHALQKTPDILAWYENWYGEQAPEKLQLSCTEAKFLPLISWQPYGATLEEIVAGQHDEYIISYISNLSKHCPDNDVLLRFAHEMDWRPWYKEGWYPWQQANAELFQNAWRHIVDLIGESAPNIKWVWSPNRADEYSGPYYPGDEYVDYVSLSLNYRTDLGYSHASFEEFYTSAGREELQAYNKDIIISEIAYPDGDLATKQQYLAGAFNYAKGDDHIVGVVYFNKDVDELRQYRINDEPAYMEVFYGSIEKE